MTQTNSPYALDFKGCFQGPSALTLPELDPYVLQAKAGLRGMQKAAQNSTLPVLTLWQRDDDLAACEALKEHVLSGTTDVIILGTGGSSLGAQALAQLTGFRVPGHVPTEGAPRFHFFDNLDAHSFDAAMSTLNLATTHVLVVSKSGSTAETMMQCFAILGAFKDAGLDDQLVNNMTVITMPGDNPLRRLAEERDLTILDHDPNIGGRFSVLSNVGLLPAILMGLDAHAIRAGAASVMRPILDGAEVEQCPAAYGAIVSVAFSQLRNMHSQVLMPYTDRLELFAMWYRQLWAESLGKHGRGTTPIRALGPVDQHSQLQLYLDGPNDKLHTLIMLETEGRGARVDPALIQDDGLSYLSGRTMGDLVHAEQVATAETLIKKGRPVRLFQVPQLDEVSLGALMMHFMAETMIAAHLLDVNAFDQPAVEDGKVLAREFLSRMD